MALELDRIVLAEGEAWLERFKKTYLAAHSAEDLELMLLAAFSDGFRLALPTLFQIPVIDHLTKRKPQ